MKKNNDAQNAIVMTDIAADMFDHAIDSYLIPASLAYVFNNPGFALVAQRPNPDIDPARIDTTGSVWVWRKGMPYLFWDKLRLIAPLKELIKEFTFHKIQQVAYSSATAVALELFDIQDRLKDPTSYPWSREKVLAILAGLRTQYDHFYAFKEFYRWAADNGKPGFDEDVAWRIRDARTSRSEQFTEHAAIKHRKHVLSLSEDRAIRQAVTHQLSPVLFPALSENDKRYTLEEIAHWFGAWSMEPGSAKKDNTAMHASIKGYRALLKQLRVPPIPIPLIERTSSITGYVARVHYKAEELLPALRSYMIRHELVVLRSKIMTHLAYALGPRGSQIIGLDEDSLIKYEVDGEVFYSIDIPSRKKRSTTLIKHSKIDNGPQIVKQSKRRKFPEEIGLGQKIERYISLKREAESLGFLKKVKTKKIPLFISNCTRSIFSGERPNEQDGSNAIGNFLKEQYTIKRSAKDLRANVGQRLADAGYSAEIIAETLDHDGTRTVKHYVQASLKLSEILDIALEKNESYISRMEKLSGVQKINREDISPGSDIISGSVHRVLISGIGVCQRKPLKMGACSNEPVYSCYGGCPAFVPFNDVIIHTKVLAALKAEVIETLENASKYSEPTRMSLTHSDLITDVTAIIDSITGESA